MRGCETHGELLGGYVLRALEPAEMEEMRVHLEGCPRCAREERELSGLPSLLDLVDPADTPSPELPPELEEAVLDRYVRERGRADDRTAGWRRPRMLAAAATVAVLGAVALAVLVTGGADDSAYARVALTGRGPEAGRARVAEVPVGTRVSLEASRLEDGGTVYELWCIAADGRWVSGGTFRAGRDGRAEAELTAAVRPGEYHRIVITRRPARAPEGERGVKVLAGRLLY